MIRKLVGIGAIYLSLLGGGCGVYDRYFGEKDYDDKELIMFGHDYIHAKSCGVDALHRTMKHHGVFVRPGDLSDLILKNRVFFTKLGINFLSIFHKEMKRITLPSEMTQRLEKCEFKWDVQDCSDGRYDDSASFLRFLEDGFGICRVVNEGGLEQHWMEVPLGYDERKGIYCFGENTTIKEIYHIEKDNK